MTVVSAVVEGHSVTRDRVPGGQKPGSTNGNRDSLPETGSLRETTSGTRRRRHLGQGRVAGSRTGFPQG